MHQQMMLFPFHSFCERTPPSMLCLRAGGHKLMGSREFELLDPNSRYGVWRKSVDFKTFYLWYMRDPFAQKLRLRAPLEGTADEL